MKTKHLIIFFLLIVAGGTIWFFTVLYDNPITQQPDLTFARIPIVQFDAAIPRVEITVEDKTIEAVLDLGSSRIMLPREYLKKLENKTIQDKRFCIGIRGKKYEYNMYTIPKIKIGNVIKITEGCVQEMNEEYTRDSRVVGEPKRLDVGTVGWTSFSFASLLLECAKNQITVCGSLESLRQQGYPIESFIETPLYLDRNFLEFDVATDKGPLRCILDTGATSNALNKDLEGNDNSHMSLNLSDSKNVDKQFDLVNPDNVDQLEFDMENEYEVSSFKIANRDFGVTCFKKIKMPFQVDAIIGMEFIHSKLIFIDFPNEKLYFYEPPPEHDDSK